MTLEISPSNSGIFRKRRIKKGPGAKHQALENLVAGVVS
jgi:hypothetical protein